MRALIAIALLIAMTPGASEVIETAAHLIAHADLPHHEADADDGCSEHSCTPLGHHCGCHATMSAQTCSRTAGSASTAGGTMIDPAAILDGLGRVGEPPPLRPPIG